MMFVSPLKNPIRTLFLKIDNSSGQNVAVLDVLLKGQGDSRG